MEPSIMDTAGWTGPEDPENPVNWSPWRKWTIVATNSLATFMVSFGSSVFSGALPDVQRIFGVSNDVALLGIALYVLGFALGPMVWGPASELYGKTRPMFAGLFLFALFQIPCAAADSLGVILAFRFLGALAGSSVLAIVGGMFVDFLTGPAERGVSTALFSLATFCGPAAGPIAGNALARYVGWRWTSWVTLIGVAVFGTAAFLATPETSGPVILRRRAASMGLSDEKTGQARPTASVFVQKYLTKPPKMLVLEPILLIFTIYMSLVYGVIYLTFSMYPLAFVVERNFSQVDGSLPFISIFIGVVVACVALAVHSIYYLGPMAKQTKIHVPERRLPPMIAGSFILPAGIFWFAWTSNPSLPWLPQAFSGILIGCGSILVFMSGVVYLIEVYLIHANSALAINNLIRSVFAAAFPYAAGRLFAKLGLTVGGSVVGGICAVLIPFPYMLWRWGTRIRSWSRYAFHE
ncbi:hypothetical protein ACKVV1_000120 [Pyricularia oryzae]